MTTDVDPAPYRRRTRIPRDDDRALIEARRLIEQGYTEHQASVVVARGIHPLEPNADRRIRRKLYQTRTAK